MSEDLSSFYNLYLPVAEVGINLFLLIFIGLAIGAIAGMCGIGGGVISIPVLISMGIPTSIAITTSNNQVIASSFSSYLIYSKKKLVDHKLALLIIIGSILGSILGMFIFYWLSSIGKIEIFVSLSFIAVLSFIGMMSAKDAAIVIYHRYKRSEIPSKSIPKFVKKFKFLSTKFPSMKHKVSLLLPILIGFIGGVTLSLLGIGGSLIIMPILIYVLGVPHSYAAGTVSVQMMVVTTLTCIMHSLTSGGTDIVLAVTLVMGTVFGAQIGVKIGTKFSHETFKVVLAVVLLVLCAKMGLELFATPQSIYSVERVRL